MPDFSATAVCLYSQDGDLQGPGSPKAHGGPSSGLLTSAPAYAAKLQQLDLKAVGPISTIENIDACLNFLAAKGINIQGLSAEEIRNGNLKAILGLFFSLSRYKQQQQQPQKQHLSSPLPPAVSQAAGTPSQCQAGTPQQQGPATPQAPCQPHQPAPHQQSKAQAEMQS
ncbi:PREDICTED: neuron navigator 2-like, partial [Galeopterus variegatus]|uniref:Neuron navigator 2-like n=1 Tax=Galeopterus variegatus TaxID=482537 RepID=A0ABM0Q0N2_GALVR